MHSIEFSLELVAETELGHSTSSIAIFSVKWLPTLLDDPKLFKFNSSNFSEFTWWMHADNVYIRHQHRNIVHVLGP